MSVSKKEVQLHVEGMTCVNCSLGITKYLQKQGFEDVLADFATGEVSFRAIPTAVATAKAGIERLGFRVVGERGVSAGIRVSEWWYSRSVLLAISAACTLPLLLGMVWSANGWLHHAGVQMALSLPVMVVGWWYFGRSAWSSLRAGIPNMDVLVVLGTNAAWVYSLLSIYLDGWHGAVYFETASVIITLVLLGGYLEQRAIGRTTSAVAQLLQLQDTTAQRIVWSQGSETTEQVAAAALKAGDKVWLRQGERIPADGTLYEGSLVADESMMSGESLPIPKQPNSQLIAGTMVTHGNGKYRVTAAGEQTQLSQIVAMVKRAQANKPRIQRFADQLSAWFVPVVLLLAAATFVASYAVAGVAWQESLMRAIAVLVVACPCAMGLATPVAMVVSIGRAAQSGLLIKGADTVELLAGIQHIAFDKTGTLTEGQLQVSVPQLYDDHLLPDDAKRYLYSLEQHSRHPIAQAVVKQYGVGVSAVPLTDVVEQNGWGLRGTDAEGQYWSASSAMGIAAQQLAVVGQHDIYLQKNNAIVAGFDLTDTLRPEAAAALAQLRQMGEHTYLISGDRADKCQAIAQQVGIEQVYAPCLPPAKLDVIHQLQQQYGSVAMVGDGMNDAPALTAATVGISLGGATPIAIQAARVVLLHPNLQLLPQLIQMSRQTMRVVKQNLFWAFAYNLLMLPLAAVGKLNPMLAAAAMSVSSLLVVANSLRLRAAQKY